MTDSALQFCDKLRQDGLQPNVITYSALISACGEGSVPERALQLFAEMRQQTSSPM